MEGEEDGCLAFSFSLLVFRTQTRKTKKTKKKKKTILKKKKLLTPPPLLFKLFELLCVLFFYDESDIFLLSVFFQFHSEFGCLSENVLLLDFS